MLEQVCSGSNGQRVLAPGLLADLLADAGITAALQASLAADESLTQASSQLQGRLKHHLDVGRHNSGIVQHVC